MAEFPEPDVAAGAAPEPTTPNGADPVSSGDTPLRSGYSRVLLKLGGEMFGGGQVGLDPDVVH
jgi:uridylate kinase